MSKFQVANMYLLHIRLQGQISHLRRPTFPHIIEIAMISELDAIIIRPKTAWQLVNVHELWRFRELLYTFSWRDIKLRYKQTALGVMWVLFQPLVNTVIFTVFFGQFAQIPSQNLPYPVFVLIGLVFWGFFSGVLTRASNSFIENEQLVKKVYFPRELLPLSTILTAGVDFGVSLIASFIVFMAYQIPMRPLFWLVLLLSTVITIFTSAGLGLFISSVNIKYRDVRYILPFFLQLLIFVTPVIYPLTIVRPSFQWLLSLNPMTGVIDSLRSSLATNSIAHPEMLLMSSLSAVGLLLLGFWYFRATERFFADEL